MATKRVPAGKRVTKTSNRTTSLTGLGSLISINIGGAGAGGGARRRRGGGLFGRLRAGKAALFSGPAGGGSGRSTRSAGGTSRSGAGGGGRPEEPWRRTPGLQHRRTNPYWQAGFDEEEQDYIPVQESDGDPGDGLDVDDVGGDLGDDLGGDPR